MNPRETLLHLGLEEKEAAIYMALLELNEASVLQIAKHAGIKRPTAYVLLDELEKKAYVTKVVRNKKTFFVPQHPQKLITETEIKLRELKEVMPQLNSLFQKDPDKPRITIFEGKDKLDQSFDEAFVVKGEIVYIGTIELSLEAFARTYRKMQYAPMSSEFTTRELIDESEKGRAYQKEIQGPYRKVRFIPKELLPFEMDLCIYGNRTLITSVKKNFFTVSIESKEIANAFRTLFNVMWSISNE